VNIIIDTHIFLWLIYDPKKVDKKYMKYIEDLDNAIYLSSISIAEIMIKKSIGNLDVDFDMFEVIDQMGLEILDFDGSSALYLGSLPFHHRDPWQSTNTVQKMWYYHLSLLRLKVMFPYFLSCLQLIKETRHHLLMMFELV